MPILQERKPRHSQGMAFAHPVAELGLSLKLHFRTSTFSVSQSRQKRTLSWAQSTGRRRWHCHCHSLIPSFIHCTNTSGAPYVPGAAQHNGENSGEGQTHGGGDVCVCANVCKRVSVRACVCDCVWGPGSTLPVPSL